MASISNALGIYLKGIPEVADALAHTTGIRIYQGTVPQGIPFPAVTLQGITGTPDYHLRGEIGDLSKIVQVDVYAPTEIEAEEISEKIRLAPLSGYSGLMNETVVLICTIQSERAVIVQPVDSSGRAGWRRSTDYRITYEREVVTF